MRYTRFIHQTSRLSAAFVLVILLLTTSAAIAGTADTSGSTTRYGAFGLLDHRSRYGTFWFPEPLRVGEVDVDNEVRIDWLHQERRGHVTDEAAVELEKAFGLTTVEVEIPYVRESDRLVDPLTGEVTHEHTQGVGNVEVSVRRPVYQFVSPGGFFDNTVGVGLEIGIPTNSRVSQNAESVFKMFDALRLGEHVSIQSTAGYSILYGSGEEGGNHTLEYEMAAGYTVAGKDLALSHVEEIIPLLELKGERGLRGSEVGENNLSGTIGVRVNLAPVGSLQPRLGVGYVFPVDRGARDDFKWGVVTSMVFEY